MLSHHIICDQDKTVNLNFPGKQVYVFNPTRGFIYFAVGENVIPSPKTAKLKIPPLSERIIPLHGENAFGIAIQFPNPTNPAFAQFYGTPVSGLASGLTFATPIDPPIQLDQFDDEIFSSRTEQIPMVGRWLRLHWSFYSSTAVLGSIYITLDDGHERYRVRAASFFGGRFTENFSDFAFRTNSTVTITIEPGDPTESWSGLIHYEYLDRAEVPFPTAHKEASRAKFLQFPPTGVGVPVTANIASGFKCFAMGMRVKGAAALCKNFELILVDLTTNIPYFRLNPDFWAYPTTPNNPDMTLVMPGEVQNMPASGAQGQLIPVGSVTAFGGATNEYQFSRRLDLTVFAETQATFIPYDNATAFANVTLEGIEAF